MKSIKTAIENYTEKNVTIIKVDVEKIKERFTQYIGYEKELGFLQLIREVVQNSIDEGMHEESPCDCIVIIYNTVDNIVTVVDNGRGMPFGIIEDVLTVIQSSGKFDDKSYKVSSGENGVNYLALPIRESGKEISLIAGIS